MKQWQYITTCKLNYANVVLTFQDFTKSNYTIFERIIYDIFDFTKVISDCSSIDTNIDSYFI